MKHWVFVFVALLLMSGCSPATMIKILLIIYLSELISLAKKQLILKCAVSSSSLLRSAIG